MAQSPPAAPLAMPTLSFPDELFEELSSAVRGPVFRRSDAEFATRSQTFNGKLKSLSRALVSPLDAQDVSAVVKFCAKHKLSPSVKSGAYGIAGWAVAGDIILDLGMLREVDIELPLADAGEGKDYTGLRDMPGPGEKGKGRAGGHLKLASKPSPDAVKLDEPRPAEPIASQPDGPSPASPTTGGKRRRFMRSYDAASHVVASFLRGPPLPAEVGEQPRQPPAHRRRLHSPEPDADADTRELALDTGAQVQVPALGEDGRQISSDSMQSSSAGSGLGSSVARTASSGAATTPPTVSPVDSVSAPSGVSVWNAPPSSASGLFPMSAGPSWGSGSGILPPGFGSLPLFGLGVSSSPFGSSPLFGPGALGALNAPMAPGRPVHAHAYVTFGAGMRQRELDLYTAEHLLEGISGVTGAREPGVVPYHIPSSAHPVGSSIMLLAGFGFMSRLYGLSIDNLVEVEMVLADGRIVVLNKDDDPDLWWALRGAGPAFGIATRYKARAFPVPVVFAGNLIYRFHRATAPSLLKHFRDCIKGAPRELYANVLLTAGPADKDSLIVIQMCYLGSREQGMAFLQAVSSWDGERCLLNEVHEKSYLNQQDSVAQILRGKVWRWLTIGWCGAAGRQWFMRSALITSLPDDVINKTVIQFANTPIGCTWIFELSGGAIADFEDTCLPKEQREAIWTVAALHQWEMGIDDPRCIKSAEEWIYGTIGTVSIGGPFPTFLGRHEHPTRTMACFGKHWARLAELKRKYDPNCLFKNNFWPLDKDGQPIEFLANEPPSP
ncbi:hypothetical protein OBBRIDRAFT_727623 [Obba rivulosa]|uniref:FAD-binding PCMH-type domain-containing protein n=1 Tax=Obba rivulosa TaxID=1052685 RepID=A0A8E2B171_9APHY|nr:hypothetical protein OBBRIDRAFT_727623 [Obba rivulosa]